MNREDTISAFEASPPLYPETHHTDPVCLRPSSLWPTWLHTVLPADTEWSPGATDPQHPARSAEMIIVASNTKHRAAAIMPELTPHRNGVDLRGVTLSDGRNAYDLFQELAANPGKGRSMKAALAKLIQSKNYLRLVDGPAGVKGTKLDAIAEVVRQHREAAFKIMLKKYPELRAQVYQRQLQVKSALSANRAKAGEGGGPMSVEKMLKDMGY